MSGTFRAALLAWIVISSCLAIGTPSALAATPGEHESSRSRLDLRAGWQLQSACVLAGAATPGELKPDATAVSGAEISSPAYVTTGWIPATVPSTVVAAQVASGVIKDPFFGMNMRQLPGMDFPVGGLFSNLPMLDSSPYKCGWWYRTGFRLPAGFAGRSAALHLDGVNYRADVWLNGKQIASKNDLGGTWRLFELELTDGLLAGKANTLAIEVFPETKEDLGITWVDWNPSPPDKNTGLFREVYLTASGPVELRFPYVASRLSDNYNSARLTPIVEAWNTTAQPVETSVIWEIEGKKIRQDLTLAGNEKKTVLFDTVQFPELTIRNPKLWWPAQYGTPHLYHARVSASVGTTLSESHNVAFGIREVTSEVDQAQNRRLFRINGKPIVIRGGGWAPDMLLRSDPKRMDTELRYVRDMGLNTIRLEGKLEGSAFYDLADQMGILVMPGWCCCDMWERWNDWGPEQWKVAEAAQRDQARLLRNHPSVFAWLYGSDNPPPVDVEKMYLRVLQEERWPNPTVSSASATPTAVTRASGVKMTGPYDYVPPNYWLLGTKYGGAEGFNTETSPGPAIPTPESLRRFIPADKLWPQNEYWGYHAGGERFQTIDFYNTSLDRRYGAPKDLNDFIRKAYAMDYEGERAMFESYVRNKYNSTGVVQWMLNNAWPSIIWHLYDYYLVPTGGYYGTRKADEPVHVLYSYNDRAAVLVSENGKAIDNVSINAKLYDINAREKWSQQTKLNVTPDLAASAFTITPPPDISTTYFLRLTANDASGKLLSENFYWLSTKPDELDWAKSTGVNTPQSDYADMTGLQDLPTVIVRPSLGASTKVEEGFLERALTLQNSGEAVAFMVHLRLIGPTEQDAIAFWGDNFVSLLPGESRRLTLHYRPEDAPASTSHVVVDGWNVKPQAIPLQ